VGHLYNYFFLVCFLIGIAIVFLASEFGWRLGTWTEGHAASGNISALEQSLLGLLALIVVKRTRLARRLCEHACCQNLIGRNH
jgi:hypothetical protein